MHVLGARPPDIIREIAKGIIYIYTHTRTIDIPLRWCCSFFFLWFILDVFTLHDVQVLGSKGAKHVQVTQGRKRYGLGSMDIAVTRRWDRWDVHPKPHSLRASTGLSMTPLLGVRCEAACHWRASTNLPLFISILAHQSAEKTPLKHRAWIFFPFGKFWSTCSASRIDAMVRPCSETVDRQGACSETLPSTGRHRKKSSFTWYRG